MRGYNAGIESDVDPKFLGYKLELEQHNTRRRRCGLDEGKELASSWRVIDADVFAQLQSEITDADTR